MMDSQDKSRFFQRLILNDMISDEQFKARENRMIDYIFDKAMDQLYGNDKTAYISQKMMHKFYSRFDEPE